MAGGRPFRRLLRTPQAGDAREPPEWTICVSTLENPAAIQNERIISDRFLRHPPASLAGTLSSVPMQALHSGTDAALICGADPVGSDVQSVAGDLEDRRFAPVCEEVSDDLFPSVGFVSGVLLRCYYGALECGIGPPPRIRLVFRNGCGEQLVAVAAKRCNLDGSDHYGPEAPAREIADRAVAALSSCAG